MRLARGVPAGVERKGGAGPLCKGPRDQWGAFPGMLRTRGKNHGYKYLGEMDPILKSISASGFPACVTAMRAGLTIVSEALIHSHVYGAMAFLSCLVPEALSVLGSKSGQGRWGLSSGSRSLLRRPGRGRRPMEVVERVLLVGKPYVGRY